MSSTAQSVDVDTFLASLRDRTAHGVSFIAYDGGELPAQVRLRESSSLVFSFSAAEVNRAESKLPRFAVHGLYAHVPASVIGFSDPSLTCDDRLLTAWYSGHEGFELQKLLPELIRQIIDALGATRIAFVGASSGGFASLYYSWHIPDSVAVVINPQTNLNRYLQRPVGDYRAACWPALAADQSLDAAIQADLCALYATRFDNTVVYIQTASDYTHLKLQFAPFLATLPHGFANRLIVRMANWGRWGHKAAPPNIWMPWMTAALTTPETTSESIEQTWVEQNPDPLPPLNRLIRPYGRDEQIAARLARLATGALLDSQPSGV